MAPERNREHSIGNQILTWNVGFMARLLSGRIAAYRQRLQKTKTGKPTPTTTPVGAGLPANQSLNAT